MKEPIVLAHDHTLVIDGLGSGTLRDMDNPRAWDGLSAGDCALLVAWLVRHRRSVVELHTDVELGSVPNWLDEVREDYLRRQAKASHPLRADAVVLTDGGWWLLEVKPNAGYQALGQLLTYQFYAGHCCSRLVGCKCGVVTNRVQPCIRPVYGHYDLEVFEVGDVISGELPEE